ncbi:MAG: RNA polymerase sigma factor [Acidimicrobiia bacterium]|nr:MAG: RNA polymerase sigma factor [Acidimicrobiia bacterium]
MDRLTTLLLDARDGDRDAFAAAIRESEADVTAFVRHWARACDVDDVVQDTYVRAWGALGSFRAAGTGRAWLLAIARRACADAVRAAQRRRRILHRATEQASRLPGHEPDPAAAHALGALIGALDAERREAIVLTQVLGLSYEEAAQVCRVPVGTIRSRVARGRAAVARAAEAG